MQVNAFLGIRLIVRNASRREQTVSVGGEAPQREIRSAPRQRGNLDLRGRCGRAATGSWAEPRRRAALLVVKRTTP